jgi:hypothetical protein
VRGLQLYQRAQIGACHQHIIIGVITSSSNIIMRVAFFEHIGFGARVAQQALLIQLLGHLHCFLRAQAQPTCRALLELNLRTDAVNKSIENRYKLTQPRKYINMNFFEIMGDNLTRLFDKSLNFSLLPRNYPQCIYRERKREKAQLNLREFRIPPRASIASHMCRAQKRAGIICMH